MQLSFIGVNSWTHIFKQNLRGCIVRAFCPLLMVSIFYYIIIFLLDIKVMTTVSRWNLNEKQARYLQTACVQ